MMTGKDIKKPLYFRIDVDDLEKLNILASESLGLNRSDIVRIAIKKYLIENTDIIENYYKKLERQGEN